MMVNWTASSKKKYNGGMNFGYILCGSLTVVPCMERDNYTV